MSNVVIPKFDVDAFHGIHAMLCALYDSEEKLDRSAMRRQVDICLDCGVHGMAALGLASEVSKLSEAERRTVMDWMAEDTAGRVPLGARAGLPIHDRAPALRPVAAGEAMVARFGGALGPHADSRRTWK